MTRSAEAVLVEQHLTNTHCAGFFEQLSVVAGGGVSEVTNKAVSSVALKLKCCLSFWFHAHHFAFVHTFLCADSYILPVTCLHKVCLSVCTPAFVFKWYPAHRYFRTSRPWFWVFTSWESLSSVYLCLHDSTAFSFGLMIVCRYHSGHVSSTVRHPLSGSGWLPSLHVLVALVDTGQRGHMEDVSDAVLRLQGGTL